MFVWLERVLRLWGSNSFHAKKAPQIPCFQQNNKTISSTHSLNKIFHFKQVPNPSAANDEGITALHNAICAGHFDIVK